MPNYWYRDAIVYELDVKTFQDSDGDGVGDFPGLTRRLPYVAGLGATCLWLRPFHPSPLRDDGYDVTDYYAIDPRLGTFGDFVVFMREARELGLRVIADLVVNHTSDEHPWFRAARSDPESKFRDWYVWAKKKPRDPVGPVFPGPQKDTWTYDDEAKAYYHHRFFAFQPDLNTGHPAVREEIDKIIAFWLELGLSGFRLDAVPFMLEHSTSHPDPVVPYHSLHAIGDEEPYWLLREFRRFVSYGRGDAILLAEANVAAEQVAEYFGPGASRMHLLFNFLANQHLMLALARGRAEPLVRCLHDLPTPPRGGRWVLFLRNHDELDLGRLTDREREEVFAAFAPDESMRAYGRGVRRRLAPMLGGDPRRVALAHSLLLTLPDTALIRSGDEIGMGDDLSLPDRLSVRTPMQWSPDRNAGFSTAPADRLIRPVVRGGPFGFEAVNVACQEADPDSLLSRVQRLIRVRKSNPEFVRGRAEALDVGSEVVFAHRCESGEGAVIACHNLAGEPARATVRLDRKGEQLTDLLEGHGEALDGPRVSVELPPYGYRWFRVVGGKWRDR